MDARNDDRSLGELFGELTRQMTTLVRQEVELARTEMTANASRVARSAAMLIAGGVIAYAVVLALVAAVIIGLATLGMPAWLSALLVGAVVVIVGVILAQRGIQAVKGHDLAPRRTIETLKEDAELARGRTR